MAQTWQSEGGRVSPASVTLMSSHRPLICHTYRWHLLHEWAARIKRHIRLLVKKTKRITASKQSLNQSKCTYEWVCLCKVVTFRGELCRFSLHSLINYEDLFKSDAIFLTCINSRLAFDVSVSLYPLSVSLSLCTYHLNIPASVPPLGPHCHPSWTFFTFMTLQISCHSTLQSQPPS